MTREPGEIDIQQLLAVALDEKPSEGFADRVLDHLAVLKTAVELSRLVGVAPLDLFFKRMLVCIYRVNESTEPAREETHGFCRGACSPAL